jgi:hypothetical protein
LPHAFTQVSYMAYFSTLKMEATVPPKRWLSCNGLHSVIAQTTELKTTAMRTSNPTRIILEAWFGVQSCLGAGTLKLRWVETVMVACVISSTFYSCSSLYFYFFHLFLIFHPFFFFFLLLLHSVNSLYFILYLYSGVKFPLHHFHIISHFDYVMSQERQSRDKIPIMTKPLAHQSSCCQVHDLVS